MDNELNIYIENPWVARGHDDEGLGESVYIDLTMEQVKRLFVWLQGVISDDGESRQ